MVLRLAVESLLLYGTEGVPNSTSYLEVPTHIAIENEATPPPPNKTTSRETRWKRDYILGWKGDDLVFNGFFGTQCRNQYWQKESSKNENSKECQRYCARFFGGNNSKEATSEGVASYVGLGQITYL